MTLAVDIMTLADVYHNRMIETLYFGNLMVVKNCFSIRLYFF